MELSSAVGDGGTARAARVRVLVIEDDDSVRDLLVAALANEGYAVVCAPDGAAALGMLRRGLCRPPEAILLDLEMPHLDGVRFAWEYGALACRHAPFVVVSGAADRAERAALLGAASVIAKPFDLDEVLAALARAVNRDIALPAPTEEAVRLSSLCRAWGAPAARAA